MPGIVPIPLALDPREFAESIAMEGSGSIFLDFSLPNATTWFYFSLLLVVALFFKFTRLLSMRNWDVLTVFLFVPGLLLLLESSGRSWFGYLWLLGSCGYFLARCFLDLALVRRPALTPNLNLPGLAWLGGALFVSLIAVAVRQPNVRTDSARKDPAPVDQAKRRAENLAGNLAENLGNLKAETDANGRSDTEVWAGRTLAILCHLAVVAGLVFVGYRHFQDVQAGVAAATFYLLLPYTYLMLPFTGLEVGQWHHIWPAALVVWAIGFYRWPLLAGLFLGLAAGTVYFPVLAFPLWLSFYRGRGAGRFAGAFALLGGSSLIVVGAVLWINGELPASLQTARSLTDWQPWREPGQETLGFWTGVQWVWAYRMPVFIAYLALLLVTFFWPSPKNLGHLMALTAAVFLGIQFWYADQGGVYVLWYLPLLLLLVFRPNLSDRQPMPIQPETDWLLRLGRLVQRGAGWLVRLPRPLAPVR